MKNGVEKTKILQIIKKDTKESVDIYRIVFALYNDLDDNVNERKEEVMIEAEKKKVLEIVEKEMKVGVEKT